MGKKRQKTYKTHVRALASVLRQIINLLKKNDLYDKLVLPKDQQTIENILKRAEESTARRRKVDV